MNAWHLLVFFNSLQTLQAPSQVTDVSLLKVMQQGSPALVVTWTAPQTDVNISVYQVQYRRSESILWGSQVTISGSCPANCTSTVLTGLDAGTEYNVRVRAVSELGAGEWSVEQTERTCYISEVSCIMHLLDVWSCLSMEVSCGTPFSAAEVHVVIFMANLYSLCLFNYPD